MKKTILDIMIQLEFRNKALLCVDVNILHERQELTRILYHLSSDILKIGKTACLAFNVDDGNFHQIY